MTARPHLQTVKEPTWTPRQREVLDLLVRGKTNSEIASALGISLDGAKWHVSEIITRLGVDNRDEAAEYWRHYNGLRMRFTRVASAFFGSGTLKWSAATVFVVGTVVASAMVIYALRDAGNDATEPSAGDPPVSTPADPSQPGNNPGDTPATPPVTGETIDGVAVQRLTYTSGGALPRDVSFIVERGCFQCDGPATSLDRVTVDASGNVTTETLRGAPGSSISFAGSVGYLVVCSRGICGPMGQLTADAQSTIYRSLDGGLTWSAVKTFDGYAEVAANGPGGVLVNRTNWGSGTPAYSFENLSTGERFAPPETGDTPSSGLGGVLGWVSADGRELRNPDGSPLFDGSGIPGLGGEHRLRLLSADGQGRSLVTWSSGANADRRNFVGIVRAQKLEKVFEFPSFFILGAWAGDETVLGNFTFKENEVVPGGSAEKEMLHPVALNLETGAVTPLPLFGPLFSDAYLNRNFLKAVTPGPFLRVTGAGDCLNVREQPSTSAPVVACFADNVLLRDLAGSQQADGISWLKVQTPSGRDGWASAEFLK